MADCKFMRCMSGCANTINGSSGVKYDGNGSRTHVLVVEIRECNAVFGTNRLANDDLVDVVELVPVSITGTVAAKYMSNEIC